MNIIKIISGRSNGALADDIAQYLGIPLTNVTLDDYSNTELRVEINESVRGCHVCIIQTGGENENHSINDYIMELCALAYACKSSEALTVTAFIPCFPYARADKKDVPRACITGSLMTQLLITSGVDRIVSMDLHSGQVQGFTGKPMPFDNIYCKKLLINKLREVCFTEYKDDINIINEKFVLISPDYGGYKRVRQYAKELGMKMDTMHKQRDYTKNSKVLETLLMGGEKNVRGKTAIIIDDMADTMGTMISAIKQLESFGCYEVIIVVTHGILSGPAIQRINDCANIKKVIVTNTIYQGDNVLKCKKLEVVDTSKLLAEVIRRLSNGTSISDLFN